MQVDSGFSCELIEKQERSRIYTLEINGNWRIPMQ